MVISETYIICDKCSLPYGVNNKSAKAITHRLNAEKDNWMYSAGKDLCPNCRKKTRDGAFVKKHKDSKNWLHAKKKSKK